VDYNPASVGQLPNESTAVIIFERPDGDRNYAARDLSSSRFPRASCSACPGLETSTQNDVEGREIDFLAVLGRVEPVRVYEIIAPAGCLSAAEQELCGLFAEGLATYRARDWDQSERCFAQCLGGHAKGQLARRRCRTSRSGCRVTGDRGFESSSLQQTVRLSPASAFVGRQPRLSARVCAAGLATGSAETRRVFRYRANRRQYFCRAIFQYRSAAGGVGANATRVQRSWPFFELQCAVLIEFRIGPQAKPSAVR